MGEPGLPGSDCTYQVRMAKHTTTYLRIEKGPIYPAVHHSSSTSRGSHVHRSTGSDTSTSNSFAAAATHLASTTVAVPTATAAARFRTWNNYSFSVSNRSY
ncbi:hypothetical protein AMECASPLE_001554 [Ameca splendens]|uniref:Uncharacterized protein n=1 Tax=Ameca splendens TaxID=208324 RepID=A0ABV0ZI54_9TELE